MDSYARGRFEKMWPLYVGSLASLLVDCRRHFDGDLDMFVVMAVVGERSFPDVNVEEAGDGGSLQFSPTSPAPRESINIQCIADYSGIARETVRRKVNDLIARGWVARDDNGYLHATVRARKDLRPLTRSSMKHVERLFALFTSAKRNADDGAPIRWRRGQPRT